MLQNTSGFWQMSHIIMSDAVHILTIGEIKRRRNDCRRSERRRIDFQRNECKEMNSRRNDRRRNGREPFSSVLYRGLLLQLGLILLYIHVIGRHFRSPPRTALVLRTPLG